jgi:hypothetical protein
MRFHVSNIKWDVQPAGEPVDPHWSDSDLDLPHAVFVDADNKESVFHELFCDHECHVLSATIEQA